MALGAKQERTNPPSLLSYRYPSPPIPIPPLSSKDPLPPVPGHRLCDLLLRPRSDAQHHLNNLYRSQKGPRIITASIPSNSTGLIVIEKLTVTPEFDLWPWPIAVELKRSSDSKLDTRFESLSCHVDSESKELRVPEIGTGSRGMW